MAVIGSATGFGYYDLAVILALITVEIHEPEIAYGSVELYFPWRRAYGLQVLVETSIVLATNLL